eukprot:TRINITY_DN1724_c0_g1_i2.p1 TRINITY_DN1724_c0_g1~~TRINITY_DN1724_c0_g1_i2.p1  ORF type:complete len:425 (-),score=108.00 TRINITY_DN1724_c0_g1_i2:231-1505(-)
MVGLLIQAPTSSKESVSWVEHYWNPSTPRFYEHLVYGAGKPRCEVPLQALRKASAHDESLIPTLRQRYTAAAREGTGEGLLYLGLFVLIVDNDLVAGGDLIKDAAKRFPCAQALCQQARFLYNVHKDYTVAWQLFERALAADPAHVDTMGYYAGFVSSVQRDYDKAETLFQQCIQLAPTHANHLGGYARFLTTVRSKFQQAEHCFERSIAADPNNVVNLNNYAAFLAEVQKDYERAELYFRKAVEVDPSCGFAVRNLLNFLVWMRKDSAAAKELWQHGGAEALEASVDETYHPDEVSPAVRDEMAAQARFMERGKQMLKCKAVQQGAFTEHEGALSEEELCVACGQEDGVCWIERVCCGERCEGSECSCVDCRWCVGCVLQHYWHDTNGELKSFARCPTCRSEFCLEDIQIEFEFKQEPGHLGC